MSRIIDRKVICGAAMLSLVLASGCIVSGNRGEWDQETRDLENERLFSGHEVNLSYNLTDVQPAQIQRCAI